MMAGRFAFADMITISVAARMRRQVKQEILAHKRREIDHLRPVQLGVDGKCRHLNFVHKFFQARYAPQFYWL